MLEEAKGTDTVLVVDGRDIRVHSLMLAAMSEVFDRQLNGSMQESVSKRIDIEDVDFETFNVFLRFLYTDDLGNVKTLVDRLAELERAQAGTEGADEATCSGNARTSVIQNLLAVSHKYQVLRLQLWCEQQLCEHICKDDVCSILCQAHLYDAKQLQQACLGFIKNNMHAVMATRGFGSLSAEWPEVMLKVNIFVAGLSESAASQAICAHKDSRKKRSSSDSADDNLEEHGKRARSE